jgi:lysophospholipase L1-like esterase
MYPISRRIAVLGLLLIASQCARAADPAANPLRLTLPPVIYAVVGQETAVYFDNIVLTETPEKYQFQSPTELGRREARRWALTPETKHVGVHSLTFGVQDGSGKSLGTAKTELRVVAAEAGAGKKLTLLIVGDSLTHASVYPNELARLLSAPGNPSWKMLGTHRPPGAAQDVAHEGYGGWTWQRFASHYDPKATSTGKTGNSPLVFAGPDGKPALDVGRYFETNFAGQRPDVVTFLLGINDCFSANPEDRSALDMRIDAMFAQADALLAAFRRAAPSADLAIGLTTPPNTRAAAFVANYKDRYPRWGWKRIQHRLVEREIEHFGGREAERIFIVPTELGVDPVDGYPENNAVHPNEVGYRQIASTFYAWLKWRMEQR